MLKLSTFLLCHTLYCLSLQQTQVNTETDNRSQKLSQMGRNLEELYYQMEELDQWLDSAIEKTQDFQLPSVEIDIQYTSMKVGYSLTIEFFFFIFP